MTKHLDPKFAKIVALIIKRTKVIAASGGDVMRTAEKQSLAKNCQSIAIPSMKRHLTMFIVSNYTVLARNQDKLAIFATR
jgi:hypothetical protein